MDAAEAGVEEVRPDLGKGNKNLHVGVASVEPGTGALRGFYGGHDFLKSQINWAVAGGAPGSAFKPFAVAAGIKAGYSLKDTFDGNSPYQLPGGGDVVNEGEGGGTSYGTVSLLEATQDSINTAFIDMTLGMPDGPEAIMDTAVDMGIPPEKAKSKTTGIPTSSPGLRPETGISLGSATESPINMANAYGTIANDGERADVYVIEKVVDSNGETLYNHKVSNERAIDEDIDHDVSFAMQQVVEAGTGSRRPGARAPGSRQDRHRNERKRRRVLVMVRGLHATAGHGGDVRPWDGQPAAGRLAPGLQRRGRLLRCQLSGTHVDGGDDQGARGRAGRGSAGRGQRRRRRTGGGPRAVHATADDADHQAAEDLELAVEVPDQVPHRVPDRDRADGLRHSHAPPAPGSPASRTVPPPRQPTTPTSLVIDSGARGARLR